MDQSKDGSHKRSQKGGIKVQGTVSFRAVFFNQLLNLLLRLGGATNLRNSRFICVLPNLVAHGSRVGCPIVLHGQIDVIHGETTSGSVLERYQEELVQHECQVDDVGHEETEDFGTGNTSEAGNTKIE